MQKALLALEEPHEKLHKSAQRINELQKTLPRQQANQETLAIYQNETQQYIGEIRKGLAQVEELLAKEQAASMEEVNASAMEIADAAQDLQTMADKLRNIVSCFKLG